MIGELFGWLACWSVCKLVRLVGGWLDVWLVSWLVGRSNCWLVARLFGE